jgi:cytochrome P450
MSDATHAPLGGSYDPLFHTPTAELYDIYRVLRERDPVFYNEVRDVWCISRFHSVLQAARNWETFSNAHGVDLDVPARFFGEGDFLDNDPPKHDILRNLAKHRFTPRNVKSLAGLIEARVGVLLDDLVTRETVDLAADLAWELPIWVICQMLGLPESDYRNVQGEMNTLNTRQPAQQTVCAEVRQALNNLQGYLLDCAQAKRSTPGDDLLTDLIAAVDEGALTEADLVGIALLMFVAGSETTATLMANAFWLLDHHPTQQTLLRGGAVPIEGAIEEIIRFESPIQYLARTTTQAVEVDGIEIPRGARVALLYGAANRDHRRFDDAERFDVTREGKRHLGFGNGIHFCLGAPLARLEARIALSRSLERIRRYEIVGEPRRLPNHVIRGIIELPARLHVAA